MYPEFIGFAMNEEGKQWSSIEEKIIKVKRMKYLSLNTENLYTVQGSRLQ